jgi:hypothetical protein
MTGEASEAMLLPYIAWLGMEKLIFMALAWYVGIVLLAAVLVGISFWLYTSGCRACCRYNRVKTCPDISGVGESCHS